MSADIALSAARYELKFNARSSSYYEVLNALETSGAVYSRPYGTRTINNIYFDTFDLDAFQQNVSGSTSRSKLRLRWYGEALTPRSAALEQKVRRNRYGWKLQSQVEISGNLYGLEYQNLEKQILSQVDSQMALQLLHSPVPTLLNTYKRDYFISADAKVRVTVDRGIRFFDQRYSDCVSLDRAGISPELIIVEYKCAVCDALELEEAIKETHLTRTRSSKYVIGMSSILGY